MVTAPERLPLPRCNPGYAMRSRWCRPDGCYVAETPSVRASGAGGEVRAAQIHGETALIGCRVARPGLAALREGGNSASGVFGAPWNGHRLMASSFPLARPSGRPVVEWVRNCRNEKENGSFRLPCRRVRVPVQRN